MYTYREILCNTLSTFKAAKTKTVEIANCVDLDEVAYKKLSRLCVFSMI